MFALFVAVAVVAIVCFFWGDLQSERVAGKRIGYWLDEMSAGGSRSNAAVVVFLKAGETAARGLTNELRFVPPSRNRWIALKAQLPWVIAARLPSARPINWARRVAAANALGQMGPNAKLAIPDLLAAVTVTEPIEVSLTGENGGMIVAQQWDHHLRAAALKALARIDSENADALILAAKSAAEWDGLNAAAQGAMTAVREAAMEMLVRAQKPDEKTVRAVLEVVCEQETEFCRRDVSAFVSRTSPPGSLLTVGQTFSETNVLRCLASSGARDRAAAAFELGDAARAGAPGTNQALVVSEQGITALIGALKDPELKVRLNAAETLVKVGSKQGNAELQTALIRLLEDTNLLARLRGVDALRRVAQPGSAAALKLEKMKKDDIPLVRAAAGEL